MNIYKKMQKIKGMPRTMDIDDGFDFNSFFSYSDAMVVKRMDEVAIGVDKLSKSVANKNYSFEKMLINIDNMVYNRRAYSDKEKAILLEGVATAVNHINKVLNEDIYKLEKDVVKNMNVEQYLKTIGYTELELDTMLSQQIEDNGYTRTKYSDEFEGILRTYNIVLVYDMILSGTLAPIINDISTTCIEEENKYFDIWELMDGKRYVEGTKQYDTLHPVIEQYLMTHVVEKQANKLLFE